MPTPSGVPISLSPGPAAPPASIPDISSRLLTRGAKPYPKSCIPVPSRACSRCVFPGPRPPSGGAQRSPI